MKKFIKNYIELMNKYILVKVGTILLILMLLSQILTLINKNVNKQRINENPITKYNTYSTKTLTVEDVVERYFNEYKSLLRYDIELAYNLLDETSKEQFRDIDNFKAYIENVDFENLEISDYSFNQDEEYKEYIITDNFNNTYIFKVKAANEYSVILKCE